MRKYRQPKIRKHKNLSTSVTSGDDNGMYIFEGIQMAAEYRMVPVSSLIRTILSNFVEDRYGDSSQMILRRVKNRRHDG